MKPFTHLDAPQGTDEWRKARAGRLTASVAGHIYSFSTAKSGGGAELAGRRDLRTRLVCERLTGMPQDDDYLSPEMRRGTELEPEARLAYEIRTGRIVEQSGFLAHNELAIGCSLDGHFDDFNAIVEFKCPKTAIHIGYIKAGVLPAMYRYQVYHSLLVTGAEYCDFMSYDPRLPEALQAFCVRTWARDVDLKAHEFMVRAFLNEVDAEQASLLALQSAEAVA